ncbi:Competence protein F homolog, phosphoribosyltransferase domain; protein YhgH required for utilization of DNA as sole source of carbon and energy [hydrothermal vent metagenome]|uniref:Competence protein F homolog, phosphoribosyltransferase domain protein YhgH required for utilization of DNA as sole source of carbon and energy n=1 Tax=hydrothermal vent metagenome TaxID=652676 RepID=A0A3B0YSG2_9ZZZZ
MVYKWADRVQELLFPTRCYLCCTSTRGGRAICPDCYRELPWLTSGCPTCAAPLPALPGLTHCEDCQQHPPALDACHALFNFQAPIDQWIRKLKFQQELSMAKFLGRLLAEKMPAADNSILVPVPLHRNRLRQRGFNQALEIARPLRERGYQLDARCCTRTRHTPPQSELPAAARLHNLFGAFRVDNSVDGENILLIDDVLTTGATLNALAGMLKQAGAARVEAWVVARTPEPGSRLRK